MPSAYTPQQKSAITQFMNLTGTDRNQASKLLKLSSWDVQVAVNSYFSSNIAQSHGPLTKLFQEYQKYNEVNNEDDILDMSATQQIFKDVGANIEDVSSYLLLAVVRCKVIGSISKSGYVEGWSAYKCESKSKQKQFIVTNKNTLGSSQNDKLMDEVYKNAFNLLLEQGQKSAEKATCIDAWRTLLTAPSFDWQDYLDDWTKFLEDHKSIKGISRDQWNHVLKFARETIKDPTLKFHSDEQSWPALIDEFAEYIKETRQLNNDQDVDMDD